MSLFRCLSRVVVLLALSATVHAEVPTSVAELWADFDPRRDALETEIIREWRDDGVVFRHVRFLIGTFPEKPARMAALYGFPEGPANRLPAVMHIHGGGQRASIGEVKLLAQRGYAVLSVNWGGDGDGKPPFNTVEGARDGDPNTDWGAVDPTQLNVPGYSSLLPGPKQFFGDREHPKNNNWYLLTLGCRRGLTFLEQQPEVDAERLGVHGYSMGGNLTMYVAGTDARVKAAVPAVGGQGWRWEEHEFVGGRARQETIKGDVDVFRRTLSFEGYAPLIRCPVLHRSSTNDFHGWMDDVYRTNGLIPNRETRYSWTPHLNHQLSPETAITMPLWFDEHLKREFKLPAAPTSKLILDADDGIPRLTLAPDAITLPVARAEIFYSVDSDPRARFWRSAEVERDADRFVAKLPLHTLDLPLFAFGNVYHTLPKVESMAAMPGGSKSITEVCLSSDFHPVAASELKKAGIAASLSPTKLVDDFAHGPRDWYVVNAGHVTLRQIWTRKLTDPYYRGADGAALKLDLKMPRANTLTFVIVENEWRGYRGPRKVSTCSRSIAGSDDTQSLRLTPADFTSAGGALANWSQVDQFGVCAHYVAPGEPQRVSTWEGPTFELLRLEWE